MRWLRHVRESLPADASSEVDDGDVSTLLRHTDDRRRAQFLAPILLLLTFAIPVMYVAVIWGGSAPPLAVAVGLCLTTFGCWIALRRGYLTPASTVFSIALVAALLLPPAFTGTAGLSPYAAAIVAGFLVLAGARRHATATAVVIVSVVAILWLTTDARHSPVLEWRILIVGGGLISLVMALLVVFGMSGVGRSIRRLARSLEGNSRIERELQAVRDQLDSDVARQSAELQRVIAETDADIAELNRIAMKDSLTGLYNRRHLSQRTPQMLSRFARSGRTLALGIIDLDEFKSINDEMSHATGDAVLARAAELMSAAAGENDTLYRIGGDEFLILMPDCGVEDAASTARRIARVLSAASWQGQTPTAKLSATWGVAAIDPRGSDPLGRAMAAADLSLRTAKQSRGVRR